MTVISGPFVREVKITRASKAGSYVNGFWSAPKSSTFTMKASVQPLNPKEMQLLGGGDKLTGAVKFYAEEKLSVGDEKGLLPGDIATVGTEKYEIRQVEEWTSHLKLKHYKAVGIRDNRNEYTPPGGVA